MQLVGDMHPAFAALEALPRARLAHTVTPVEAMVNLTRHVAGAPLLVKRDDLTPLGTGGNKVRQLEFYLGEAISQAADTVLITGAVQSNFVRLAAAAARRLSLHCHVQLEERVASTAPEYRESGNVLLDRIFGATIHSYPAGEDEAGADGNLEDIAARVRDEGGKPYVIHLGIGHPSLGALGYVDAARELVAQTEAMGIDGYRLVVASGSGATHAGLLFGMRLLDANIPVTGVCVRRAATLQADRIRRHCESLARLLGVENPVRESDIQLDDRFLAPGYGRAGTAAREAIRLAARTEGLLVDPVYTSKSLAGAIALARGGTGEGPVLFLHTGGTAAIFGYARQMLEAVNELP